MQILHRVSKILFLRKYNMINTYEKPLHEILRNIHKMETREERIEALRDLGKSQAMVNDLLACQFNEWIQDAICLPEGELPESMVKFSGEKNYPKELISAFGKFAHLINTPANNLPTSKRERIFVELLEGVHPKDAEIVMKVFTKQKWPFHRTITKALVRDALPKLLDKPIWVKE